VTTVNDYVSALRKIELPPQRIKLVRSFFNIIIMERELNTLATKKSKAYLLTGFSLLVSILNIVKGKEQR
jgi:hypothetical protein